MLLDRRRPTLSAGQVMAELGVCRKTLRAYREAGHFPGAWATPGGHWRYPANEVEAMKRPDSWAVDHARRKGL